MSYPDTDRIGSAETSVSEAAALYAEVDRLLAHGGDLLHAVKLLNSAERLATESGRIVAAELLAAVAEPAYGHLGLSDWLHADMRDKRELRAAAAKLLDPDEAEAGDTWRACANLRTTDAERRAQSLAELKRITDSAGHTVRPAAASAERLAEAARQLNEALTDAEQYADATRLLHTAPPDSTLRMRALRLCNIARLGPAARLLDAAEILDACNRRDTYTRLVLADWHAEARTAEARASEAVGLSAEADERAEAAARVARGRVGLVELFDNAAAAEAAAAEADAKLQDASAAWGVARTELDEAVERRTEAADALMAAVKRGTTDEPLAEADAMVKSAEKRYEAIQQVAASDIAAQRDLAKTHFVAEQRAKLLADPEELRAWIGRLLDDASAFYTAAILQYNEARNELLGDSDAQLVAAEAEVVVATKRCDLAAKSYDEIAVEATAAHGEAGAARGVLGVAGGIPGDAGGYADARAAMARSDKFADAARKYADWKAAEVRVAKSQAERCAAVAKIMDEWIAMRDTGRTSHAVPAESRHPNPDALKARASSAEHFALLIADAASESFELHSADEAVQAARHAYETAELADLHQAAEAQRASNEAEMRAKFEAEWLSEDGEDEDLGSITS